MRRSPPLVTLLVLVSAAAAPSLLCAQTYTTQRMNIGGQGFFDYLSIDPGTNRVFVSRGTHLMVVDGTTGQVLGDISDTPRVHGAQLVPSENHGFTTNAGDSTSTMFDLKTLAVIKKIPAGIDGLDGFTYDSATNTVLTINHSHPIGTAVVIDAKTGDVVGRVTLSGNAPEGGVSDGKGRIFINLEDKNAIDVVDTKTWKVVATWPIALCDGPTGIALDRATNRIFSGCGKTSVVVDATTGKIVAQIPNGDGVDGLAFDEADKLIYISGGQTGDVTVVHEDSPNKYTVVAKVPTMRGARTIAVNPKTHVAYVFTPEFGPAPAGAASSTPGGRPPRGPIVASWLIAIKH
jgi:DNA-binding beta-propeller fold protein YncE